MPENLDRAPERSDRLNIEYFPPRLHSDLKVEAARRGITLRELVIAVLRKAVVKEEIDSVLAEEAPTKPPQKPPMQTAAGGIRAVRRDY